MTAQEYLSLQGDAYVRHLADAVFLGLLPPVTIAALLWLPIRIANPTPSVAGVGALFAFVGATIGILLGTSREPAVQAAVPALLTLIAGYLGWTLREEAHAAQSLLKTLSSGARTLSETELVRYATSLVFAAVIGLMLSAAMGTVWGSEMRQRAEEDERRYEEWRLLYETQQLPLTTDNLRRQMGLPMAPGPAQ